MLRGITLNIIYDEHLHDREIILSNGWRIKLGRGLDFYQRTSNKFTIGYYDFDLRPCLETTIEIYKSQ